MKLGPPRLTAGSVASVMVLPATGTGGLTSMAAASSTKCTYKSWSD